MRHVFKTTWALLALTGCSAAITPAGDAGPDAHGTQLVGQDCYTPADCIAGATCGMRTCVTTGRLHFTLSWVVDDDVDLHVRTPAGVEVYYATRTGGGGTLDVDDCVGMSCRHPGQTHVENIFFDDSARHGTYEFWAVNYGGSPNVRYRIDVEGQSGGDSVLEGVLPDGNQSAGTHDHATF